MLPLRLTGARTNNLQGVDLQLEPGTVVAVTGVSGAGKSSLALGTLYAEGQRRFVESFSPYARQFLERLERPPMTSLDPVPAAVAVDRAAPVKSSRSTVATMADVEPLLAALFLRESWPRCPEHQLPAALFDPATAAQQLVEARSDAKAVISYRVPVGDAQAYLQVRDELANDGYRRIWRNGQAATIDDAKPSEIVADGHLDVVTDRVRLDVAGLGRIQQGIEQAWSRGADVARVDFLEDASSEVLRRGLSCPECARSLEAPRAGLFSYDSPLGACPECRGFGRVIGVDLDKVVPDPYKSLAQRAIRPWNGKSTSWERTQLKHFCEEEGIALDVPWVSLPEAQRNRILEGDGSWTRRRFGGVFGWFRWLETKAYKMHVRVLLSRYRSYDPCPVCKGSRLNGAALCYEVGDWNLAEWHSASVDDVLDRVKLLTVRTAQGRLIVEQLASRLHYLSRVGLGYLSLDRQARTLSGGEAQRVTLTAALGSSLHNALFVLDEPTVGLHPTDVVQLADAIFELSARNNTVLVIEHDPVLIQAASRVLELGPGAGAQGGELVFDGSLVRALKFGGATARACASNAQPLQEKRRCKPGEPSIAVAGARAHNLQNIDVSFPLNRVVAVSGPSGSGKSTLVVSVLYRALARRLGDFSQPRPEAFEGLSGGDTIEQVVLVDQSPLGRTSRGNPATYTKAWDAVRKAFASEAAAKQRKLTPSHFSFNVAGGRCEACAGEGFETVEMQFLADVRLQCPVCQGQRFNLDVLSVAHRGMNVAQVLDGTVDQVLDAFRDVPAIVRSLGTLPRLGLGYLKLGQPLSTLSGGEAQRLKLARALSEKLRDTLFIVDEPSAGLHADEVAHVASCLRTIVDAGGSVITVEHDLELLRQADWIVDIGPGAGAAGGRVVAEGTPAQLTKRDTLTGRALRGEVSSRRSVGSAERAPALLGVRSAREHNLRNVSVDIPHGALSVVTGPSGSGKSSLVFDVLFAEGQRRFLETLTPYARQFLPTMPKPDVDAVTGVPPSVALEQRTSRAGANSTVATVTEMAHYLRLLFAKLGVAHCPEHQCPIGSVSLPELHRQMTRVRGRWQLLAPVVEARKGTYLEVFNAAQRDGVAHAICDGQLVDTDAPPRLARTKEHDIDLVMRPLASLAELELSELQRALSWGSGSVKLRDAKGKEQRYGTSAACPECGFSLPELDPRWFSFNTKQGQCPSCEGAGVFVEEQRPKRRKKRKGRRAAAPSSNPVRLESKGTQTCPECEGTRLAPIPRSVRLQGSSYPDLCRLSVNAYAAQLAKLRFSGAEQKIAAPVLAELKRRVEFLLDVGLDYLTLDRAARTLSGGEMQRLRLAAQLGAGLTGALYVLDEPTIGLHAQDTARLIGNLRHLVGLGSTVVVVEHDADVIRAADHLVDMGPAGGSRGGAVMASGTPEQVLASGDSPTARILASPLTCRLPTPVPRRHPQLTLSGVTYNNLRNVALKLPVARLSVVAGVSGSGKSSLIRGVLLPAVRGELGLVTEAPGAFESLGELHGISRALSVDQSPIGRTSRSVPATFLGIWDQIRKLLAQTTEAQIRGYSASRFSFNSGAGGRCSGCDGQGVVTHEMSFLPDVVQRCPVCDGARFEPDTLQPRYLGLNVAELLQLTVDEACEVFAHHPKIVSPLLTLRQLGAGYIQLGQGSHTLSGGESQRLKLAAELTAGSRHAATLYILDEPTTGLHQSDVIKLASVLDRLVERGDTVVVIEHHPALIAGADHVVELGPTGGDSGGRIVAQGSPSVIARRATATGKLLAGMGL